MKTAILLLALLASAIGVSAQSGGLENATRGFPVNNDGTTGTILNGTAKVNSSGNAIAAGTSDTNVPTYIVIGGAGTSGNAVLAKQGSLAPCLMDTTIASGAGHYYVIESVTNANECHPQSATPTVGVWVIGFMHDQATTSGQTALVEVNLTVGGFVQAGGGVSSITQNVAAVPELLINGLNSVTGNSFTWTKAGETPLLAWLSQPSAALGNIPHHSSSSCATSTACSVTLQVTATGDAIVLVTDPDGAPGTVHFSDSLGNTFTPVGSFFQVVCSSAAGGSDTISLTSTNSVGWIMSAADVIGNPTSSCVDSGVTNTGTSTSISSPSGPAQTSELIFGAFNNIGSLGTGIAVYQAGTGYTQVEQINCTVPNCARISQILEVGNQNTGLSGIQTASTNRTAGQTDGSGIMGLKLSIAGSTGPPTFSQITMPYLPIATTTPANGDCVDWVVQSPQGTLFGDPGFPCAPAYVSGSTSATAPSALGCNDTTVSFTPASVGQAVLVTPQTSPGANVSWSGFVSASNQVDIRLCTLVAFTPSAVTYQIRVFK